MHPEQYQKPPHKRTPGDHIDQNSCAVQSRSSGPNRKSCYGSSFPRNEHNRYGQKGTVLITTVILVFMASTIAAGMFLLTDTNFNKTKRTVTKTESENAADAAMAVALGKIENDLLPKNSTPGSIGNPDPVVISNAGDESIEYLEQQNANLNSSAYTADAAHDNVDFTNPESGTYRGMKYQIKIWEWDDEKKIGAPGVDDNMNGEVDEGGPLSDFNEFDAPAVSSSDTRYFTIEATATTKNYATTKRAIFKAEIIPGGNYALYARDELEIKPNSLFDSYKSSQGSYASQTPGTEGNIATEASLEIDSNTRIMGDAKWGGSEAEIAHNAYVHGETKKLSDSESYSEPETVHEVLDFFNGGEKTVDNNQEFTVPEDKNYEEIEMNQGATLNIQEGDEVVIGESDENNGGNNQTINVGNQSTVVLQNGWEIGSGSTLDITGPSDPTKEPTKIIVGEEFEAKPKSEINVSGRVQFHVVGEFTAKPKVEINTSDNHPYNLTLKVGGTWKTPHGTTYKEAEGSVEIKPKGDVKANLYAPTAEMEIKPKGEFFGKAVGDEIEISPKTKFHHDKSICKKNCDIAGCSCSYRSDKTATWVISQVEGPRKGF